MRIKLLFREFCARHNKYVNCQVAKSILLLFLSVGIMVMLCLTLLSDEEMGMWLLFRQNVLRFQLTSGFSEIDGGMSNVPTKPRKKGKGHYIASNAFGKLSVKDKTLISVTKLHNSFRHSTLTAVLPNLTPFQQYLEWAVIPVLQG